MALNLRRLAKVYQLLYTDRMDIYSTEETTDVDGATINDYPETPQQKDVPCRISFSSKDTPIQRGELYNNVKINPIIFCEPTIPVKAGDKIVVRRIDSDGKVFETYDGMISIGGRANKYETHQEFELSIEGDA